MANFTVSIPNVLAALDQAMPGNIQQGDYAGEATALAGHLQRQTATIQNIQGEGLNKKNLTVELFWEKMCDIEVLDECTDECTISANESTDDSTTVALDECAEVSFKVSWKRFRSAPHELAMSIAKNLSARLNYLDEFLSGKFIETVAANQGDHEYNLPVGSISGTEWNIPAADWTDALVPHLRLAARFARFPSFYLLDGLNLYPVIEKARFYGANDDGRGANALWSSLNYVFDPVKMVEVAPAKTFLINPGSIAFLSGNYWDAIPREFAGNHRMFTVPSPNLPGVFYDVHEQETCSGDDFVTSWKIRANYKVLVNPLGCNAEEPARTGILAFEKISAG